MEKTMRGAVRAAFAAFAMTVSLVLQASAETIEISTVEQLADILANYRQGSTRDYVLMKSGSPYVLPKSEARAHLEIWYNPFRLRGETGDPKDVQIVGDGNAIFYVGSPNNVISGITFTNGYASVLTPTLENRFDGGAMSFRGKDSKNTIVSNCVFACNTSRNGGAVYFGGATANVVFDSCTFVNNVATNQGGAVRAPGASATSKDGYVGTFRNCRFLNNEAARVGGAVFGAEAVEGCSFVGNQADEAGAVYNAMRVVDSGFTNNLALSRGGALVRGDVGPDVTQQIARCRFVGNSAVNRGGAITVDDVSDNAGVIESCLFESNSCTSAATGYGGAVADEKCVSNCVFRGNRAANQGGAVYSSRLYGCRIERNVAGVAGGSAYDCKLFNCTNVANMSEQNGSELQSSYADGCIFRDACPTNGSKKSIFAQSALNRCRVENILNGWLADYSGSFTNTLIAGCGSADKPCVYVYNSAGIRFVNCTIVSNCVSDCATGGSNQKKTTFVNCLFYGNQYVSKGVARQFDLGFGRCENMLLGCTNCIYNADTSIVIPGEGNYNYYNDRAVFNPGFVGAGADPFNPYSLKRSAYGVRKMHGVVGPWMANATDVRGDGYPRLREGVVDIGCYQCWIPMMGCMLIFR